MKKVKAADWDALDRCSGILDDLCEQMTTYAQDRSEKWQESDAGEAYVAWVAAYEAARDAMQELTPEAP